MTEWHEDLTFWDEVAPLLFDERRLASTPDEVDDLLAHLEIPSGSPVLDLACGVGRHAIDLARRGYPTTGVDRVPALLDRARQHASEAAKEAGRELEVEWVAGDMREFIRAEAFDGAINIFSSFGYFTDPEDDLRVARNVYESLRPGGAFIIDTMGREVVARDLVERDWRQIDDRLLIEKRRVEQDWSWIRTDWTVVDSDDRVYECSWGIRLYSGTELRALLAGAGFAEVKLFGCLAGSPYDPDADRLIAVARKQG